MQLLSIVQVQQMLLELMVKVDKFLEEQNIPYYLLGGSALGAVRHEGFIPWDDDIDIGMLRADYERFLSVAEQFDQEYEVVNLWNSRNSDFCLTRIYIPNTFVDIPEIRETKLDKRLYFDVFPLDNVPDDKTELAQYEKEIVKSKKTIARIDLRNNGNSFATLLMKRLVSCCLKPFRGQILRRTDALMTRYAEQETKCVCSLSSQYSFAKQVMPREVYGTPKRHTFADHEFTVPEQTDRYLTILFGADYMEIPPVHKRRAGHDIYLVDKK